MKTTLFFALMTILGFLISCNSAVGPKDPDSDTWEAFLIDMLPGTMTRAIINDDLQANIPIQFTNQGGEPLGGAEFILLQSGHEMHLKTNSDGIVTIALTKIMLENQPIVRLRHGKLIAKEMKYNIGGKNLKFVNSRSVDGEIVLFENLNYLEKDNFTLYYSTDATTAKAYFDKFTLALDIVREITGLSEIKPIPPLLKNEKYLSVLGEPFEKGLLYFDISQENWLNWWVYIHELIEHNLIYESKLYEVNPNTRWIGDGLAELISYEFLKTKHKEYEQKMLDSRLTSLRNSSDLYFNIYQWKPSHLQSESENESCISPSSSTVGYSYSLAFWLKLTRTKGPDAVYDFMKLFLDYSKYSPEDIKDMYELVFGNKLLQENLTLTRSEAIEILEKN